MHSAPNQRIFLQKIFLALRSNLWNNCYKIMKVLLMVSMILGDAFYTKVKGVAPKSFAPDPLATLPPILFILATPLLPVIMFMGYETSVVEYCSSCN